MTTTVHKLRGEVEQLKRARPGKDLWLHLGFGIKEDKPHGKYGHQLMNLRTLECKIVPEVDEVASLSKHFNDMPECAKSVHSWSGGSDYDWSTLESFLEDRRCKCGNFDHKG